MQSSRADRCVHARLSFETLPLRRVRCEFLVVIDKFQPGKTSVANRFPRDILLYDSRSLFSSQGALSALGRARSLRVVRHLEAVVKVPGGGRVDGPEAGGHHVDSLLHSTALLEDELDCHERQHLRVGIIRDHLSARS